MPLFKFSPQEAFIRGNAVIPLFVIEGISLTSIEGEMLTPLLGVNGGFAADGAANMSVLRVSGQMRTEANGSVGLPGLLADGEVLVSAATAGTVNIPFIGILGDMQAEGLMLMPALRASGFVQVEGFVNGDARIPLLSVSGTTTRTEWADGSARIPLLSVSGSVARTGATANSQFAFPLLRVAGFASAVHEYEYNEDDAVLRYADERRYI
jgi:hypothetical protein